MYTVYMLLCKDGSIYTGIAKDAAARMQVHLSGKGAKYTRSRGVQKILYTERKRSRSTAQKREAEIKGWTRAQKLNFVSAARATSKKHGARTR